MDTIEQILYGLIGIIVVIVLGMSFLKMYALL